MDNLNTPDNMSKNTHTKLFKLWFSGASGNNFTPVKKPYSTGLLPIVYAFWQHNGNIIWIIVKVKSYQMFKKSDSSFVFTAL